MARRTSAPTLGERTIEFIEACCRVPSGRHVSKPFVLMEWQKRFICRVLDNPRGTRTALLSIGRKAGKTSLCAALTTAFLVGPPAERNAQIVSGALTRDQAALIFKAAAAMIRANVELLAHCKIVDSSKRIECTLTGSEYIALSSEGSSNMGLSPMVVLYDELGSIAGPSNALYDALITSQGAHDHPLFLVLSTQAAKDTDLFSILIDDAKQGKDPHTILELHTAPSSCALDDESAWEAANPSLDYLVTREYMRQQAERAKRIPVAENTFRNLLLNQRVSVRNALVGHDVWMANAGAPESSIFTDGARYTPVSTFRSGST